jgi:WD40 repeat protein
MSTPNDLSTAVYANKSFTVTGDTAPTGLYLRAGGQQLIITGSQASTLRSYTLGTAYDISTASFVAASAGFPTTYGYGTSFSPDGESFVVQQSDGNLLYGTLSTAWDVTTVTTTIVIQTTVFPISGTTNSVSWSSDGQVLWLLRRTTGAVKLVLTRVPDKLDYASIGFAVTGAQDLTMYDMLATVLHAPGRSLIHNRAQKHVAQLVR